MVQYVNTAKHERLLIQYFIIAEAKQNNASRKIKWRWWRNKITIRQTLTAL